jgi:hypothetical protein
LVIYRTDNDEAGHADKIRAKPETNIGLHFLQFNSFS